MILDKRVGIGPHHLSIGKTRKIFEVGNHVHSFFSTGRGISHATWGKVEELKLPVAWGGFAFTVEQTRDGFRIAFVHADGHRLCISNDLGGFETVLETRGPLTAPWLSRHRWSVLERGKGVWIDGQLDRSPLHHSCVQLFGNVAVGFGGEFPLKTDLMWKRLGGEWSQLTGCNVNDRTTFHFGATDDGMIHFAYLDMGLGVSLATYDGELWEFKRSIIPIPCFAPNVSIVNGELNVFACDYHGTVWRWRNGYALDRLAVQGPSISPLFALTGYGTGGMLIPPKIDGDRIPVLISHIEDEKTATARLELELVPLRTTNEAMCVSPELIAQTFKRAA